MIGLTPGKGSRRGGRYGTPIPASLTWVFKRVELHARRRVIPSNSTVSAMGRSKVVQNTGVHRRWWCSPRHESCSMAGSSITRLPAGTTGYGSQDFNWRPRPVHVRRRQAAETHPVDPIPDAAKAHKPHDKIRCDGEGSKKEYSGLRLRRQA